MPLLLAARPWDLVILDEAHAARRRTQEEGEFNSGTLLLNLLRALQLRRHTRGILLLSATPMQTHPWEPWDLLAVLGEGGRWLADFASIRDFYAAIAAVRHGRCDVETARRVANVLAAAPQFSNPSHDGQSTADLDTLARQIAFVVPSKRHEMAQWLRQSSPLARRMHRTTRDTLRRYHEQGLLPDPPPQRVVEDLFFEYTDPAERRVYNAVSQYIEKRYDELEREKPGKGFVMTVYRRRVSSSPLALERSLERRRDGLLRVAEQKAYETELSREDVPEAVEPDDLPERENGNKVSAALPQDPKTARAELIEVDRVLEDLRALRGRDSKRDQFFDVLRRITEDGRTVLIFTEYTDTLEYLRDNLVTHYGKSLACYSGDGGQLWDGERWTPAPKGVITDALRNKKLRALLCTDAASEGLNLQAAGAVINYDLPWNPSKVEQRIGRIDRIGQQERQIRVVNLFLKDSVDEKVYRVLRTRCGLFEHFVGAMQPVLARAHRMLMEQESPDLNTLRAIADQVEQDPLASETYIESPADGGSNAKSVVTRQQVEAALVSLNGKCGFRVKPHGNFGRYTLSGPGFSRVVYSCTVEELERDKTILPLSLLDPQLREFAECLSRPGERLPLVIASFQRGAFRCSVAYWVGDHEIVPVASMEELTRHLEGWNGTYPDPAQWLNTQRLAQREAEAQVTHLERRAAQREQECLQHQREAARLRLQRELGRYLVCLGGDTTNLNDLLYQHMSRDIASSQRLGQCLERLGGYPEWDPVLCHELDTFVQQLTENQRKGRLLGKEVDAALEDPRWMADVR